MSKLSDKDGDDGAGDDGESTRPLNARSLALSALLGTHPPTLSARALVDLAEVFGIHGGTMRTALSRLVGAGDVAAVDGRYTLAPRLLERQAAQDAGRTRSLAAAQRPWDGAWHTAVATADHRRLAERRRVRALMANARFGELRPSVWLRPANLPPPRLGRDWLITTGPLDGPDDAALAARLWDLGALAARAHDLITRLERAERDPLDRESLPPAFSLSAEIVRFLRADPLLPGALTPTAWPIDELRGRYDAFERSVQAVLRPILSDVD